MDADNRNKIDDAAGTGEWTKEPAGKARPFDFDAFLGQKSLEDQVSDALDDKDRSDGKAGAAARTGTGARGRHEAPGPEPEPEPAYPGDPPTQRFSRDGVSAPVQQRPPQQQPRPARSEAEPPARPKRPAGTEPPPRPKVVVAEPAPRVVVTPERQYGNDEPSKKGIGKGGRIVIALLITVAVVLAAAVLVTTLLPGGTKDPDTPAPSPTDYLFGGLPTRAPSAPTAPPAPTEPPATEVPVASPAPVTYYTISVTAGTGGSVSPNGMVDVEEGGSATFFIQPEVGYELGQLLIDGANVSVTGSYTFTDVHQSHTLYAVFQQLPATEPPATDVPVITDPPVVPDQPDIPDVPETPEEPAVPDVPDAPPPAEG